MDRWRKTKGQVCLLGFLSDARRYADVYETEVHRYRITGPSILSNVRKNCGNRGFVGDCKRGRRFLPLSSSLPRSLSSPTSVRPCFSFAFPLSLTSELVTRAHRNKGFRLLGASLAS